MFNKLSFDELAKFYGGLADLEKHYGKEEVMAAVQEMDKRLSGGIKLEIKLDGKKVAEQMELIPEDKPAVKRKGKRDYNGRKPVGMNEKLIREWCESKFPALTPEKAMLCLYYMDGLTQTEIGKKIGVCQRAVGQFINKISEKKKRKILAEWEKNA